MSVDIANLLTADDVPVKLRCANCNSLVQEAFRLPCCDQNICGGCHEGLPKSCPICSHEPITPADCQPNKKLRLTVRAFLKSEEKKRDKGSKPEEPENSTPVADTPAPVSTENAASTSIAEQPAEQECEDQNQDTAISEDQNASDVVNIDRSQNDKSEVDIDKSLPQEQFQDSEEKSSEVHPPDGSVMSLDSVDIKVDDGTQKDDEYQQNQEHGGNFGYDNNMMNGFGNQNWGNGGFNPMMAMQNGMSGGFNGFPNMMGMPMGMNPQMMMSQGMFGAFNGQGMGMNGMNMGGMSYNNGGNFGGWDDGTASQMNGMMHGNGSEGYYPGNGYNQSHSQGQGNYHHHQPYANHNYRNFRGRGPFRGRGRGYGQFGAGSRDFGHGVPQRQHQAPLNAPTGPKSLMGRDHVTGDVAFTSKGGDNAESNINANESFDETPQSIKENAQTDLDTGENDAQPMDESDTDERIENDQNQAENQNNSVDNQEVADNMDAQDQNLQPISTIDTQQSSFATDQAHDTTNIIPTSNHVSVPNAPLGPAAQYQTGYDYPTGPRGARGYARGFGRGFHRGRGLFRGGYNGPMNPVVEQPPLPKIGEGVVGAPTGPKALREGTAHVRGRAGFPTGPRGGAAPVARLAPIQQQSSFSSTKRDGSPEPEDPNQRRHSPDYGPGSLRQPDREVSPSSDPLLEQPQTALQSPQHEAYAEDRTYDDERNDSAMRDNNNDEITEEATSRHHRSSRAEYSEKESDYRSSRRERSRDRDRDRDRERDRDRPREKERERDRDRDRDRRKRHHRSRSRSRSRTRSPAAHRDDEEHYSADERTSRRAKPSSSRRTRHRSRSYSRSRSRSHSPRHPTTRDRDRDSYRHRDPAPSSTNNRSASHSRRPSTRDTNSSTNRPMLKSAVSIPNAGAAGPREFKIKGTHSHAPLSQSNSQSLYSAPRGPRARDSAANAAIPTGPRATASTRRASHHANPTPAPTDPHALERSQRDRERMLKEAQRRSTTHPAVPTGPAASRKRKASSAYHSRVDDDDDAAAAKRVRGRGRFTAHADADAGSDADSDAGGHDDHWREPAPAPPRYPQQQELDELDVASD